MVPTLTLDDGTAIGEVLAIWRYLEEVYPEPPLSGDLNPQVLDVLNTNVHIALSE